MPTHDQVIIHCNFIIETHKKQLNKSYLNTIQYDETNITKIVKFSLLRKLQSLSHYCVFFSEKKVLLC